MTTPKDETNSKGSEFGPLRTFGRTGGRPLSPRQQRLMEDLLPKIVVDMDALQNDCDPNTFFDKPYEQIWFEIGFGGAEHLIGQAARNPQAGIIGAEPFQEGVAKAVTMVDADNIQNVRIHPDDARKVLDQLSNASLDRVFIMFPDPWHKTRHHKRRLIQPEFIETLGRIVKPNGKVRFATDWANYADWTLERFENSNKFNWLAQSAEDWKSPPKDHVTTRYQTKGLGDCAPIWLDFQRTSAS